MQNIKVLQCVKNYLKHIEKQNVNVGESYAKVEQWLEDNCDDKELKSIMRSYVLHRTILVINKNNLHCKELSNGAWDSKTSSAGREKLLKIQKCFDDYVFTDNETLKKEYQSFSNLVEPYATTKPWMYLYLMKTYADTDFGKCLINPSHQFFKEAEKMLSFEEALAEAASE